MNPIKKTLVLFVIFLLIGCSAQPIENTNVDTLPSSSVTPRAVLMMPVTLPVLDAMFFDPEFAGELKSELQLNDEQIEKLKIVSREAVKSLSEDSKGGSTQAAAEAAEEQIHEILGDEKTRQLSDLVRKRWAEGFEEKMAEAKPNAIPGDTRIVVNAPAYRMDIFENGKLIKTYKIGIGYPEFPLPQGERKARAKFLIRHGRRPTSLGSRENSSLLKKSKPGASSIRSGLSKSRSARRRLSTAENRRQNSAALPRTAASA